MAMAAAAAAVRASSPEPGDEAREGDPTSEVDGPTDEQPKKPPAPRVWLKLEGPNGETGKIRVKLRSKVYELRNAVAKHTMLSTRVLQLKIQGRVLEEARRQAFEGCDASSVVVHWWRQDRLKAIAFKRKFQGLNGKGWLGRTMLQYTVLDGDFNLCSEVLNSDGFEVELINARDALGDTALMFASIQGFNDIVELLLDRQAETDHKNLCGRTALTLASEHGHAKAAKALLLVGANRGGSATRVGTEGPNEVYLAELNGRESVLQAIDTFEYERTAFREEKPKAAAAAAVAQG